jgi:hypothetical protein
MDPIFATRGSTSEAFSQVIAHVASAGTGGEIQLRVGSRDGDLIGKVEVTPNGSWAEYVEQVHSSLAPNLRPARPVCLLSINRAFRAWYDEPCFPLIPLASSPGPTSTDLVHFLNFHLY